MISRKFKKVLSGFILAIYIVANTIPAGLCITTSMPQSKLKSAAPNLRQAANPTSLKLEGDISITKSNPKITLSLRDSDVRQVLRMFADKAGLNIIFHDSATGKVTLDLVNVPLNDAFKMVMQITNLTYYIDQNTMVVISASSSQSLDLSKQEMSVIPIKYVDAAIIADFLNKNIFATNRPGLSNALVAVTNPSTNEVLIFGTKNDYLMAKKIAAQFDVKPRNEIFTVNHTTPKEMATLICELLFKEVSSSTTARTGTGSTSATGGQANASSGSSSSGSSSSGSGSSSASSESGSDSSSSSDSEDSEESDMTLGEGVIQCNYKSTVTAGNLSSLDAQGVSVTYFQQKGTIEVIGGSQHQMELVKEFIAKNDKKQPQAYLELSILELNESGSREFSNTWKVWSEYFSGSFTGKTTTNELYPTFFRGDGYRVVDAADPTKVLYSVSRFTGTPTVSYAINYLIQNKKARVLANPKIIITNGQQSTIDLSSDYVAKVTSQVMTSNGTTGATQRTYEIGKDEGIKVNMTPFISPDNYVTLNVKPEYSTVKGKVTEYNAATKLDDTVATLLQRRNLDLKNVRIRDGETLVIGGMMREIETKNVAKIPVLGDLPGIGVVFRNSSTEKEKQELVIMITPRIIKDSEDLVNSKPNVAL